MMTRLIGAAAIAALLAGSAPSVLAQAQPKIPRAADGKPDLSGIWITGGLALLIGDKEAREIQAADRAAGRTLPPPEQLSYLPAAEAKRQYYLSRRGIDDPMARCFLSGVPRITTRPLPFQIIQMKDQVILLYEAHHAFRIVPTDGRRHPDDIEPSFLGDSVGRWEGDTLVVDTVNFSPKSYFMGSAENLHLIERFTRTSTDTITYQMTLDDPATWTKSWSAEMPLKASDQRLYEYACHEGNGDLMMSVLRGAHAAPGDAQK
jgi:hypothetical protein